MGKTRVHPVGFRLGYSKNWNSVTKVSNFPQTSFISFQLDKLYQNKTKYFYKKAGWWDSYKKFLKILETTKSYTIARRQSASRYFNQVSRIKVNTQVRRRQLNMLLVHNYFSTNPAKFWSQQTRKPYGFVLWRFVLMPRVSATLWWRLNSFLQIASLAESTFFKVKFNFLNAVSTLVGESSSRSIQYNMSGLTTKYFKGYKMTVTLINLAILWRNSELISILLARELRQGRNQYKALNTFSRLLPSFVKAKHQVTGIHVRYRGAFVNATQAKDVIFSTRDRAQRIDYQTLSKPLSFFLQPAVTFRGVIAVAVWLF